MSRNFVSKNMMVEELCMLLYLDGQTCGPGTYFYEKNRKMYSRWKKADIKEELNYVKKEIVL